MKHFPIYMAVADRRIAISGGGDAALAKLRLLLKTEARIEVYASDAAQEIHTWAAEGRLTHIARGLTAEDVQGTILVYAADEDSAQDARVAQLAITAGVPVNVVDNLADSAFITPAIVDRDPVTIAIGTEGAAPVLARALKAELEERLSPRLGLLARVGRRFRAAAEALPFGRARRDFWSDYYLGKGPLLAEERDAEAALTDLLDQHLKVEDKPGHVAFVGAGPGDPELLTLKARKALDTADVVIHDRLVSPEILELARREATLLDVGKQGFGPSTAQDRINDLIVKHAAKGAQVVRLKGGDANRLWSPRRRDRRRDRSRHHLAHRARHHRRLGLGCRHWPEPHQTRPQRLGPFPDRPRHEGLCRPRLARACPQPGQVAAIYMGKKAARFIQGRLIMHGALP